MIEDLMIETILRILEPNLMNAEGYCFLIGSLMGGPALSLNLRVLKGQLILKWKNDVNDTEWFRQSNWVIRP